MRRYAATNPVRVPEIHDTLPALKVRPRADASTGYDVRDQPRTAPEVSETQFASAANRLQSLARQLQEHWRYIQLLHVHLEGLGITPPSLPAEPSFGVVTRALAGKVSERFGRLERHLGNLETTLEQHWIYLQRLERYLGSRPNASQIRRESSNLSLFLPTGTVDERLTRMEKLLDKLEESQRGQRVFLKETDALFRTSGR
jgi:hypothetical protein